MPPKNQTKSTKKIQQNQPKKKIKWGGIGVPGESEKGASLSWKRRMGAMTVRTRRARMKSLPHVTPAAAIVGDESPSDSGHLVRRRSSSATLHRRDGGDRIVRRSQRQSEIGNMYCRRKWGFKFGF